ncbi:MAG TPA: metal-dependent hydrolase [Acidobacteriota bacterium]|jgi:L-ascorbate metabolism protein UlaG (beta-lactamase superfamily)|nr:metal-dependent hydrolase [Acidobacteriota bacterium]
MQLNKDVTVKYLGHATFLFTTPAGNRVLIDPWVDNNPACPEEAKALEGIDTMLITHAHPDHMQDAVALAQRFQPQVACNYEISIWLGRKGVENVTGMNKGGSVTLNDVKVTMTNAYHSSGILDDDGSVIYGGEPAGFVVEFENGFRIYHAGDTCVFGDMKLIADLYAPDLLLLPIGDLFTMDPREAAYACRLMNAKLVIPMHYGTFPVLTGTPDQLRELTSELGTEVIALQPGEAIS